MAKYINKRRVIFVIGGGICGFILYHAKILLTGT
jgi:hypothetical protein